MPLTGIDDAWQTRIPQGWQQFADGSIGPPNQAGSDWNAPYRGAPAGGGIPDWLKQLIPSPGASVPNAPGGPVGGGGGPQGYMPGGGVMGRQAVTPGGPSMGFPAQGGPDIFPPRNSTLPLNKSVGPFTGGASTENAAGGPTSWADPRNWFRANPSATFQQGQPMGPDVTGAGGFNPLSLFGGGNPAARAAIAASGVMAPTPTANDAAPTNMWNQRPSGVGGMPGPQVTNPAQPMHPSSAIYPSWPTTNPATTMAAAPPGNPSDTPRPSRPFSPKPSSGAYPMPPRRPAASAPSGPASAASNPRFGLYQSQVPSGAGPLSRNPIYTTLNLFGARS